MAELNHKIALLKSQKIAEYRKKTKNRHCGSICSNAETYPSINKIPFEIIYDQTLHIILPELCFTY